MTYLVRATWKARPDSLADVRAALIALVSATRQEPGNQLYLASTSTDDPTVFGLVEVYDDEAAFQAHLATAHFKEYGQDAVRHALESRSRETFTPIEV